MHIDEWRDARFFPRRDGVDGWRGVGRVMVVGLNPSTTYEWTPTVQRFYATLKRIGLQHAHLTDVLKERMTAQEVSRVLADPGGLAMARNRRWFLREVDVLRPRRIIALGPRVRAVLDAWLGPNRRVRTARHYAPRFPNAAKRRRFAAELAQAARESRVAATPARRADKLA